MSPKLYLHIGPHKTGTTYIQRSLLRARDPLLSQGLLYANVGGSGPGHHDFVRAARGKESLLQHATLLDIRDNGSLDVCLSSENFSGIPHLLLAEIVRLFDGYSLEIVQFVRRPSDLLYSHWQEETKQGRTRTLAEYLAEKLCHPFRSHFINPLTLSERLLKLGGSLSIVVYDNLVHEQLDIADYLVGTVFGRALSVGTNERINSRLALIRVEVVRLLNREHQKRGLKPSVAVYHQFLRRLREDRTLVTWLRSWEKQLETVSLPLEKVDQAFPTIGQTMMTKFGKYVRNPASDDALFLPFPETHFEYYGTEALAELVQEDVGRSALYERVFVEQ